MKPVVCTCPLFKGKAFLLDLSRVVDVERGNKICPAVKIHVLEAQSIKPGRVKLRMKLLAPCPLVMCAEHQWTATDIPANADPWGTIAAAIRLAGQAFPMKPDGLFSLDGKPSLSIDMRPTDLLDWKILQFWNEWNQLRVPWKERIEFLSKRAEENTQALSVRAFSQRCQRKLRLKYHS